MKVPVFSVLEMPFTSFELPLEIIVLGLIQGLVYSVLGIGLVMVYKTSRVINFAHGEMGALAAALMPVLVARYGWSYWTALALALALAAGLGIFMEMLPVRRLTRAPRLIVLVATIGAAQLFFAINSFLPKAEDLAGATFPTPFKANVTIGNLHLGSGQLLIVAVVPTIVIALISFFRYSKLGLASRAAAENADAARLTGIPVRRISLTIWVLAGLLAGVSAILIGATQPLVSSEALGPNLMLRALGAAMLGGMASLPRTFAGGLAVGLLEMLVQWNFPTGGALELVLLVVLVVSLLAQRGLGQLARGGETSSWSLSGGLSELETRLTRLPRVRAARVAFVGGVIVLAALLPLPFSNATRLLLASIVVFAMMGLSLTVLTGYAGQISLGQFAFVALGALVASRLHQLGYPSWVTLVYAAGAGGVAALVVGLPALRIRGLFLAVVTLGFGVASQSWLFRQEWLVNHDALGQSSTTLPRPTWFGIAFTSPLAYYQLCLAALVVLAASVSHLRHTGLGRSIMAVRDNEPNAAALGVSPRRTKLVAFVISGMIAATAGWFYGALLVNFRDPTEVFNPAISLALVGMVVLGGVTTVSGAILGAIWLRGAEHFISPLLPGLISDEVAVMVGGIGLLVAILQFPGGIVEVGFRLRDRAVARVTGQQVTSKLADVDGRGGGAPQLRPRPESRLTKVSSTAVDDGAVDDGAEEAVDGKPALEARDIVVRYGGNLAVDTVTLRADPGEIVGLVGPNGAGKTTLFDVLSGHLRPDGGCVLLHGHDVTRDRPERRANLGLGRTFQQAKLFDDLPLLAAVQVAFEAVEPTEAVPSLLALPPSWRAERGKEKRAEAVLEVVGLAPFAHLQVRELSTGMRRMAELGTIIALGADVVLLDEPTAGLAQGEVEAFRPVLRQIREHLGATIVIIEHDIPMITRLVDRLYVLAAGEVIAEGPPTVLRDDPAVVAAYLGTDERVIQRSGRLAPATAAEGLG